MRYPFRCRQALNRISLLDTLIERLSFAPVLAQSRYTQSILGLCISERCEIGPRLAYGT